MALRRLMTDHSLFRLKQAMLDVSKLAMKGNVEASVEAAKRDIIESSNANAARILSSLDSAPFRRGQSGLRRCRNIAQQHQG